MTQSSPAVYRWQSAPHILKEIFVGKTEVKGFNYEES